MIDLESILDLSPPFLLALAINFLLLFGKRAPFVPDWTLPLLAMAAGGLVYPLISDAAKVSYQCRHPDAFNAVMGVAIGGMAVAFHQTFRQIIGLGRQVAKEGDTACLFRKDVSGRSGTSGPNPPLDSQTPKA